MYIGGCSYRYRTRANKGRSILEAALEYRPQKQGVKKYFLNRGRSQIQAAILIIVMKTDRLHIISVTFD